MKAPVILAVDTKDLETAKKWIAATQESVSVYKLGLEFFLKFGRDGYKAVTENSDSDIFLDLKLHDIPNTVGSATESVADLRPRFLTVHASGGAAMIAAAVAAAPSVDITAVTILTSLSDSDVRDIGFSHNALESATNLAQLSIKAGAKAIVSSPLEIASIRGAVGDQPIIITPGVRMPGASGGDDQVRTMSPRDAIKSGASFVVIGRPITGAWKDGASAMTRAALEIAEHILD